MKKILRYTSLFIIAIGCIFIFDTNVYAVDGEANACTGQENCKVTDGYFGGKIVVSEYMGNRVGISSTTQNTKGKRNYSYSAINISQIYFGGTLYQPSGVDFDVNYDAYGSIYCLDGGLGASTSLYAQRFLIDPSSEPHIQAQDHAFMAIMTSGSNDPSNVSNDWAKRTALRAIAISFRSDNRSTSNDRYNWSHYAIYGLISRWLDQDSSVASLYDSVNANGGNLRSKSQYSTYWNYYFVGGDADAAKSYYVMGMQAALDYLETASDESSEQQVSVISGNDLVERETVEDANGTLVKVDVKHRLDVGGFNSDDEDSSFVINGITFEDGVVPTGVTSYYISQIEYGGQTIFQDDGSNQGSITGQNLIQWFPGVDFSEVQEMVITVHFEGYQSLNEGVTGLEILTCGEQPIDYSLDGTYKFGDAENPFGNYIGVLWYPTSSEENGVQRFIAVYEGSNENAEQPWTSPKSVSLTEDCDCDALAQACIDSGDINSPECDELFEANCGDCVELEVECALGDQAACDEYAEVCVNEYECNTEYTNITACCDESGDLIISTADEVPYEIHGVIEDKIKLCFITQVDEGAQPIDDVGNSYKMETDDKVRDNDYCSVNCREDYAMELPSAKRVNAGRYFTFRVGMESKKQCFTNTIDKEKFEADIKDAQEAIVEAANDWLYWQAAYENRTNYQYTYGYEEYGCSRHQFENGVYISVGDVKAWTNPTYIELYYSYNEEVSQETTQSVYEYEGTIGTHQDGTETCSVLENGEYVDEERDVIRMDETPTIEELEDKLTERIEQEWNEISDGHVIEQAVEAYARIIEEYNDCSLWESEYNYEPSVMYDYQEQNYREMAGMPIDMKELSLDVSGASYDYCLQQGHNEGPTILDNKYTECSTGWASLEYEEGEDYTICELEGDTVNCKADPEVNRKRVSLVRYMKSEQNASSEYVPDDIFYNAYPSGEITVTSADNNVLLEEKLPVALSTRLGIYEYYVNISEVGEYYDDGDQGRFIGSGTPVIGDELNYVCAYLVNIPEAEFVCDGGNVPSCEGEDCISKCIGPNCEEIICDGDHCIAKCVGVGCIYDTDAGTSLVERQISLSELFPEGTDSYNWDISVNDKAMITVSEIEEAGNGVYDEEPILSLTITPSAAREIKAYNDEQEQNNRGGYSNETVYCEAIGGYEEIGCYSSFIDDLINGRYGNDVVNSHVNRSLSSYFTLWDGGISEDDMIGPSWK